MGFAGYGAACSRVLRWRIDGEQHGPKMTTHEALEIRVRGRVQGVGFRPNVARLARELGVAGDVMNDAEGVLIRASGTHAAMTSFLERITRESPPLARVDAIETRALEEITSATFQILESEGGAPRTEVAPDAAICADCAREITSRADRRFRYPFTTCTHCGPRLSIVRAIPYDRRTTTMADFPLCDACDREYRDVADRRFHAEATACAECGPKPRLVRFDGAAIKPAGDAIEAAARLIADGAIVAIKGLGGYHLACDATRADSVQRLRDRKKRDAKPFALMARDLDVIRRYCNVSAIEEKLLASAEAPIVLLDKVSLEKNRANVIPEEIAPGITTLGFMLPTTPLHFLLLHEIDRPVVMTSGNISDAPSVIDDADAAKQLSKIADCALMHDRGIANRVDDSVVRVMDGRARMFRRARGHAPAPIRLPRGFENAPSLLAYGAELKSTFCLLANGEAIVSQHQGDLDDANTFDDYEKNLALFAALFEHMPTALVADLHPDYASSKLARDRATAESIPLLEVQHHHAHVAACLAENDRALLAAPVLGIVLDGLGLGEDGEWWGGEFLLADYRNASRLASLMPAALLGGDQASREPWRNLYAQLSLSRGWSAFARDFSMLDVIHHLSEKPLPICDRMLASKINAPSASSCGRLFDAAAAAVGICFDRQAYEGQAGSLLEAAVDRRALQEEDETRAYPFSITRSPKNDLPMLDPAPMWQGLFEDLAADISRGTIAARFHRGLANAMVHMTTHLHETHDFSSVALSGGCFQNRVLFEETSTRLRAAGFAVLSHARIPANDGGIALGQSVVAAARLLAASNTKNDFDRGM